MEKLLTQLDRLSGPWLIFIAAVLWSLVGGVSKSLAMDPLLFAGVRALVGGLVLLPMLKPRQLVWDKWLVLLIVDYTLMTSSILVAMRYTAAGNVIALQDSALVWVFLWALVVNRQPMGWRRVAPVVTAGLGLIIFLLEPNTGSNTLGNVLALFGGVGFAILGVCLRKARAATPLSLVVLMNLCSGVLILLTLFLLPGYSLHVPLLAWPVLLAMSIIQLSGGYLCYTLGMRKIEPRRAQLLCAWELVLSPVWAFLLVGELPTAYGVAGWLVMLVAIFLEGKLQQPGLSPAALPPCPAAQAVAEE